MSHSVAARFELVLLHDFSTTDARQVPFAGAVVQFYGQGATVSNADPIPATTTIEVFDTGDLFVGASVMAGIGGPTLTVTAINSSTQITISGASSGLILPPGTRLILTSNRPEVFSDPRGTISLSNSLTADSRGRVTGYIRNPRFDYVVEGETVVATYDASSSASISGGYTTSWTHATSANLDRIMFVAISWTGTNGGEAIESVTYNGIPLIPVGSANFTDIYLLLNPPSGSHTVAVSFQNTDVVNAVVGAVTMFGWNTQSAFVMQSTGAGSGTSASTVLGSTSSSSLLLAFLGIGNQTSFATVTTAQTTMWNNTVGTSSPFRTNGAGERTAGTGSNVTMSFSWSGSRQWGILAVELKAATARLFADVSAGVFPVPDWLSAQSFPSIQDAIDALPDPGGTVYLPAGNYEVTVGIVIPIGKAVHLLGDGVDRTVIYTADADVNILWVKGSYSTIEKLTVRGANATPTDALSGRGIVVGIPGEEVEPMRRISLIDCRITETGSFAYHVLGIDDEGAGPQTLMIWGHAERTVFERNVTAGGVMLGVEVNSHVFLNCAVDHFRGIALNAHGANALSLVGSVFEDRQEAGGPGPYVLLTNGRNILLSNCWFETHEDDDTDERFIEIGVTGEDINSGCHNVTIESPRFARKFGHLPLLVRVLQKSTGVSVLNPTCHVNENLISRDPGQEDISVVSAPDPTNQSLVLVSGGIITSLETPLQSGLVLPPDLTGMTLVALGPRLTPPLVTDSQRDDADSLAADRRRGDLIYNQDTGGDLPPNAGAVHDASLCGLELAVKVLANSTGVRLSSDPCGLT